MPQLLHIVSAGGKSGDGNLSAGICGMRPRNQRGAGRIGVDSKLPAREILTVLCGFCQADGAGVQLVIETDRSSASAGNCHLLGIRVGTGVQRIDGTVGVPQFQDSGFGFCLHTYCTDSKGLPTWTGCATLLAQIVLVTNCLPISEAIGKIP